MYFPFPYEILAENKIRNYAFNYYFCLYAKFKVRKRSKVSCFESSRVFSKSITKILKRNLKQDILEIKNLHAMYSIEHEIHF